ncbi:hypothetical protein ACT4UM_13760 [Bacillus sp. SS-TM]
MSGSNKGNKTDNASDDEAEFVNNQIDFRIGEGANAKDGGVLKPGESAVIRTVNAIEKFKGVKLI